MIKLRPDLFKACDTLGTLYFRGWHEWCGTKWMP